MRSSRTGRAIVAVFFARACPTFCFAPADEEASNVETLEPLELRLLESHRVVMAPEMAWQGPRKPVMWVHLHKNAGSTMCIWARLNAKEKCVKPWANCNSLTLGDDWIQNGLATKRNWTTCEKRAALFHSKNFTWGQIEREVSDGDLCMDDFLYGIMLRDPTKRLQSYINGNSIPDYRQWIKCVAAADARMCPKKGGMRVQGQGHENFDNFLVRTLGGYDVMSLPPGAVNATHYEAARLLLKRFDLVVVLEQLHTQATKAAMDRVLGWHPEGPPMGEYKDKRGWRKVTFDPEDVRKLRDINKFDEELYYQFTHPPDTKDSTAGAEAHHLEGKTALRQIRHVRE